jgi:hypothetical protein
MFIRVLEDAQLYSTKNYIPMFPDTFKRVLFQKYKKFSQEKALPAYKSCSELRGMKMLRGPLWVFFPRFPDAFVQRHSTFGSYAYLYYYGLMNN